MESSHFDKLNDLKNKLEAAKSNKIEDSKVPAFIEEEDTPVNLFPTVEDIFGFQGSMMGVTVNELPVDLMQGRTPIPHKDKFYPNIDLVTRLAMAMSLGQKTLLVGGPGTGKTKVAEYVSECVGLPFFRFNFQEELSPSEFLGKVEVVNEGGVPVTKGVMAEFGRRFQEPGVILLDEIMRANAATSLALQSGFERAGEIRLQHMAGDVVIKRHPQCYIILADNTHGTGDGQDKYVSNPQDQSWLNRIEITINVDYPSKDVERSIVKDYGPTITDSMAGKMVDAGRRFRQSWKSGELSKPFTPRNLQTIAEIANITRDPMVAFKCGFTESLPSEDERTHCVDILNTVLGVA
jgi:MoxR-like ATPase